MPAVSRPAPVIIAIDGRSGAGKTTLALELAALLREHRKVSVFHLEEIYPGWNGLAAGIERYVSTVLEPLSQGIPALWASWDWENHYDGAQRSTPPADVIIIEGVGAAHASARNLLDVVVWVEAEAGARKRRALDRDGGTFQDHWDQWAAQEDELLAVDDPAAAADLLVEGRADGSAPAQVLLALGSLPVLETLLTPERAHRRGLELQVEPLDAYPDPAELFAEVYGGSPHAVWLDSSGAPSVDGSVAGEGSGEERNRFSIMADDGGGFGQLARHAAGATWVSGNGVTARIPGPFFRWLDSVWGRRAVRTPDGYDGGFALGWLGYLGYELKRETGGADAAGPDTTGRNDDAALLFAGRAVVVDHRHRSLFLLTLTSPAAPASTAEAQAWCGQVCSLVARLEPAGSGRGREGQAREGQARESQGRETVRPAPPPQFAVRDTATGYKDKIASAQAEIAEGNSYEICLTTALSAGTSAPVDPWRTYLALRHRSPAPFGSFLRFGRLAIGSTSPERFLRISADGAMRAEPIKGTRRRHPDPHRDAELKSELEHSAKDRAENVMIVDLLRNDLSHFAVPDSVSVPRLCAIESYATVHQMVSTVDAQLRPGSSRAEAVAAAFPAGSMTGAPKISTMAILDRLEAAPRGVYSGAIGYFSLNGATDLSVTIRTLVMETTDDGGRLSLGVGGAITADSSPHEEWLEVRAKAYGVLSALGADFPPEA
ncbi:MAG TPA: aminodeoxychorismate synthase component I [Micrococcaceae bacterium]|nr:aminodeoxychorismate synthase component I [Micrococcaceae bacterium]